jgi:hypothetical protein
LDMYKKDEKTTHVRVQVPLFEICHSPGRELAIQSIHAVNLSTRAMQKV